MAAPTPKFLLWRNMVTRYSDERDVANIGQGRFLRNNKNTIYFSLPVGLGINEVISIDTKLRLEVPSWIINVSNYILAIAVLMFLYFSINKYAFNICVKVYYKYLGLIFISLCIVLYIYCLFNVAPRLIVITEDSISYIGPVLKWLAEGHLNLTYIDFGFPVLLRAFAAMGSINHIPVFQLLLYLLTVAAFSILISKAIKKTSSSANSVAVKIFSVIILLSYFPYVKFSFSILPEISYQFLAIVTLMFLVLAIAQKQSINKMIVFCLTAILCSSFNLYVKPSLDGCIYSYVVCSRAFVAF